MKIVVIGAGSASFGRACVADILGQPAMKKLAPELVLVDIDGPKLARMRRFAERVKAFRKSRSPIRATTDRLKALPGADYVLISVTRRRFELWEQDYRIPLAYGFMQAYGENGGPGALFHALRSIHLILPICRDVERLCPDALVFNYSNPESRVLLAMLTLTRLSAVGLCHGQHSTRRLISQYLKKPDEEIHTVGAGINHFFWLQEIKDKKTGRDLYPSVCKAVARDKNPHHALMRKFVEVFGLITYPHNQHIGEYVQFAAEFTANKWPYGREVAKADQPITTQAREEHSAAILSPATPIEQAAGLSREMGAPMIVAHATNTRTPFISGNVLNDKLSIPNLLPDGVVEVPVEVDGQGFHPVPVEPLPECLAAWCRTQMSIQKLTVQAYKHKSKNLLLQALLLDPFVNHVGRAEAMLDEMLALQADYLPRFR